MQAESRKGRYRICTKNSQDKPVVIGNDHGFSLMQTKHHIIISFAPEDNIIMQEANPDFKTDKDMIRGTNKTISFRMLHMKKSIRGKSLGESYERGVRVR